MGLTVTGVEACVRWGYHQAATLRAWTVSRIEGSPDWTLAATVEQVDAFRVSQRPLVFVASHAKGAWRWPVIALQIQGASCTATLGPKEK